MKTAGKTASERPVVVSAVGLTKVFRDFWNRPKAKAVNDIDFEVHEGEVVGLLGPNGSGKSTTVKMLLGLLYPTGGRLTVFGKSPRDVENKKLIGYLPEERGLYPKKKIIDQLVYFAELSGMSAPDAVRSVDRWLARLGMSEYRNKRLDTLSKGNQQKIQLITALAHDPQIVVLDEPFSGLDPVNAMLLKDVVKEEIAKGKIVLFSSHQMNYIEEFCDSIAILNGGKVVLTGDLREIKRNYPRNRLVVHSQGCESIARDLGDICKKTEDGGLLITLASSEDKSEMMRKLTADYDIDEIKVFEPSLNDIFVEYAEKGV